MDYLGWELERQRGALAALLLGGGRTEERESLRDGERRSAEAGSAGVEAAGIAAGEEGRSGGVSPDGTPGAWETVRRAGQGREDRLETPVSAWEGVLEGWTGGREPEGWSGMADFGRGGREAGPSSGGTGAWGDAWEASGGRPAGKAEWETRTLERTARLKEARSGPASGGVWAGGGEAAGAPSPGTESGGGGTAGREAEGRRTGQSGPLRREGGTPEAPGRSGTAAVWETASSRDLGWGGEAFSAAWAGDGAKALSRAVQRDARRYDGGFSIY